MGIRIVELKKLEPNVTAEILARFKTELETEILKSPKRLKQEIRIELGEHQTFDNAVQKAIEIESNLTQNKLRNATTSILFNFETPNSSRIKTVCCQLCREIHHEALFCMKASCFYCKSKEHVSYHCRATEHVLRLICKLCCTEGHPIDIWGIRLHNVLLLQNTNCVGNVRKEDTIHLRAIIHRGLRTHAKTVAARRTRLKIAGQHCVRGATTSDTQ